MKIAFALLFASVVAATAAQPRLKTLKVSWAPYAIPQGCSNVVICIWKSTSLGTVWTPFKPTAYTAATRTNTTVTVIAPGNYKFYATAQGAPLPESGPSNTVTNIVTP